MLETINCLPFFVGNLFEADPHQHCASNMIADSPGFTALASFQSSKLFGFPMKLLDIPSKSAHLSHSLRGVLLYVIRHGIIRALGGMRNPEELHLVIFWKSFDFNQLAMLRLSFRPFKRVHTAVLSQAA